MNQAPTVLKNFADRGNSLMVKLTGVQSNKSAIGASILVTSGKVTQTSVVTSGSSYLSQSDFRQHFGLGKANQADRVQVVWPSGVRESFEKVDAGQEIRITEGKGIQERVPFAH